MNDRKKNPEAAAERMLKEWHPVVRTVLDGVDQEFADILFNDIFNRVYGREERLDIKTRELCTVAMLTAVGRLHDLKTHLKIAFNLGWSGVEIREVILLCAICGGWPAAFDGVRMLDEYCRENGIAGPPAGELRHAYTGRDWIKAGYENGAALFGKSAFEDLIRAVSSGNDFQEFILIAVYGKLLTRNRLEKRTVFLCLIAAFAASRSAAHLGYFISAGLKQGILSREIEEVLLYCCIYAGQEASLEGLRVFRKPAGDKQHD
ncbi:MAG: carboxymuconolactone decarboxylase family protein [Desulfobacterales bacterium]